MKMVDNIEMISSVVESISEAYDIDKVYLFGSCSRGEETASSDIDLCLETGDKFSLLNAASFSKQVQELTGRRVDVVTEKSLFPHVSATMRRDRKLVYERI